jgi:hypothetical protein
LRKGVKVSQKGGRENIDYNPLVMGDGIAGS